MLVHLYYGWTGEPDTLPNITIEFDENLMMTYTTPDTTIERRVTINEGQILFVTNDWYPAILDINVFCSKIMGFDNTSFDGNRYIFVKQ